MSRTQSLMDSVMNIKCSKVKIPDIEKLLHGIRRAIKIEFTPLVYMFTKSNTNINDRTKEIVTVFYDPKIDVAVVCQGERIEYLIRGPNMRFFDDLEKGDVAIIVNKNLYKVEE